MLQLNTLDKWRNITGIGHGAMWGLPTSSFVTVSGGSESMLASPWPQKSSPDIETPRKDPVTVGSAVMNAAAPVFVPGGYLHCTNSSEKDQAY
jgi:hypothetical protein